MMQNALYKRIALYIHCIVIVTTLKYQDAIHIAMTVPECINKNLLETSLRKFLNDDFLEILDFTCKPAVPPGDNYTSYLYRVTAHFKSNKFKYEKHSTSVIIKIQPVGNNLEAIANGLHLFDKEIEIFSKILPSMYEVLGSDYHGCLSSLCLHTITSPNKILVLEDLQLTEFKMAPRQQGLDLDHCKLVIKKLAIFHAASLVLFDKDSSIFNNFSTGLMVANEIVENWMNIGLDCLKNTCLNWPEMEKYGRKIEKMGPKMWLKAVEAGDRKLGGFNVLNHGDIWSNNMLFTYHENGKVKDSKLLDFQLVKYTSPAIDLHYFLGTSASLEVRQNHIDQLLDIYYGHLIAHLADLDYCLDTVPSREGIINDFKSRALYGVLAMATVAALVRAPQRDDASFEDLLKEDGVGSFRHHCYNNENYKEFIRVAMPQYDFFGAFN